jgi:Zn-dependent protease with chaperone function
MLGHEFFHEQAHLELRHEFKRCVFMLAIGLLAFLLYRFFCHCQEFEADNFAAKIFGLWAAYEALRFLQIREGKRSFLAGIFSLHPRAERRICEIL